MILTHPEDVPKVWVTAREHLLPAIERSKRYTEASVLFYLLANPETWRLWTHEKAALITRIVAYPKTKVCEIYFAGGEKNSLSEWENSEPQICAWARNMNCDFVEMIGREGWEKKAHPGWEKTAIRMTRKT